MRTRAKKPLSVLVSLGVLAVVSTTVVASPASADPPVVEVVSHDDLAPTGLWAEGPGADTGTFDFVTGPAPTPGGTGSLELTIASGEHEWLASYAYGACATTPACNDSAAKTPIADLDALGYSTYRDSGSTLPTFNIETHTTGVGGYTSLVFIPSGPIVDDTWQTWDAMNPAHGSWWSSQNVGGVFSCAPFACSATWAQVVSSFPNAKVAYGLGPNVGTGGTFVGNVDNFTVGVSGSTKVFDFERVECTTTCSVDPAGDDAATGTPNDPLQTIQAGITKVQAGGTVLLTAGTFTENVVVDKSVHVQGSGPTTVVVPATSDPNCGGSGGGSLCPGASNVILVQAHNVTIDQLTVDGDNPSLTGMSIGGADVDARNGIITNHVAGTFNSLSVDDVTVKNIYLRGIYASSGGTFSITDNTVDNVQGEAASIGIFNFGGAGIVSGNDVSNTNDAISANWSRGTQFLNNVVTASGSGVHTDNAGSAGGSTADVISGNDVSACASGGWGVWTFVPYLGPTVTGNTVSGCEVGMAALASCDLAGTNSCPGGVVPTVTFTDNQVTGAAGSTGLYVTTNSYGFGDGPVKVTSTKNTFTGHADAVLVEETGGKVADVTATRSSFAGNTVGVRNLGATNVRAHCSWWGQATGPVAGQFVGSVTRSPYLITSDLNSSCAVKIYNGGVGTKAYAEGDSGTTQAQVVVRLDRRSSGPVTVQWYTSDGTATVADNDYTPASGTLTWPAGTLYQYINVDIIGDTTPEANETFTVTLHSPTGAGIALATKTFQITNDD